MKILNNILKLGLVISSFIGLYTVQKFSLGISLLLSVCISLLWWIPFLIKKLFHYEMSEGFICFFYSFMIVALTLGSIYNGYDWIPWLDLHHYITGLLMCYIAEIILEKNKISYQKNK